MRCTHLVIWTETSFRGASFSYKKKSMSRCETAVTPLLMHWSYCSLALRPHPHCRHPGICFHHYCAVYDECKYSDTLRLADRTHLFLQYTISLSSLCKLIWRHWTYKMPVRYSLLSVWVRSSIFSPLSIMQYMGLYVFSLPISLVLIERIYIPCLIITIKLGVWTITHCLELGHESMMPTVCLSIFFVAATVGWLASSSFHNHLSSKKNNEGKITSSLYVLMRYHLYSVIII